MYLAQRLIEHPGRQRLDEVGLLRGGNEVIRWQQAVAGMAPAHECLDLCGSPVRHGDDRLVVQHELELVDRIAQLADQRQAPAVVTALLDDRTDAEATSGTLGRV